MACFTSCDGMVATDHYCGILAYFTSPILVGCGGMVVGLISINPLLMEEVQVAGVSMPGKGGRRTEAKQVEAPPAGQL